MNPLYNTNSLNKTAMKRFNVPSIDGIPGIMPGTGSLVPPPPEEELVEEKHPAPQNEKNHYVRRVNNLPKHKRRMMPCNKKNSE